MTADSSFIQRICLVPRLHGLSGMTTFQNKLARGLAAQQIQVTYDLADLPYAAILVVGGTRHLGGLLRARRLGIPVIQRLNGMNWIHRVRQTGIRHYLRAEYGNQLLDLIRTRLASGIVYQSGFSKSWWEAARGATPVPSTVIYNGVDLQQYSPAGTGSPPSDRFRILLLEGNLMGGYESGLEAAVRMTVQLANRLKDDAAGLHPLPVELRITGNVPVKLRQKWTDSPVFRGSAAIVKLSWDGVVARQAVPEIARSAHLLYSGDVHAACPNSVIEALACGCPVAAFDTGALAEMVNAQAGRVVPYGSDPWRLEPPNVPILVEAVLEILKRQDEFRPGARQRAEAVFNLDDMVASYREALLQGIS